MLLALDAGNSNITIGAFEETKLIGRWRLRTIHEQTADEWGVLMRNLFALASLDLARVDGIIIASVVPTLDAPLLAMSQRYFQTTPLFVTPETDIGLRCCTTTRAKLAPIAWSMASRRFIATAARRWWSISEQPSTSMLFPPMPNIWAA